MEKKGWEVDTRGRLDIGGQQIPIEKQFIWRSPTYRESVEESRLSRRVPIVRRWAGVATLLFDNIAFLLNCGKGRLFVDNGQSLAGEVFVARAEETSTEGELLIEFVGYGELLI